MMRVEEPMSENDSSISFRDDVDLNKSQDASALLLLEDLDDLGVVRERLDVSMQSGDSPSSLVTREGCWNNSKEGTSAESSLDQVFRLLPRSSTSSSFNSRQNNKSATDYANDDGDDDDDGDHDRQYDGITEQQEHGESSSSGDSVSRSPSIPLHKKELVVIRGGHSIHSGSTTDPECSFPRDSISEDCVIAGVPDTTITELEDDSLIDNILDVDESLLSDTMGSLPRKLPVIQPNKSPSVPFSRASSTPTVPFRTAPPRPFAAPPPPPLVAPKTPEQHTKHQHQLDYTSNSFTPPSTPPLSSSFQPHYSYTSPVTPTDDALSVLTCFEDNNTSPVSPSSPSGWLQPSLPSMPYFEPEKQQQQQRRQREDWHRNSSPNLWQLDRSAPSSPVLFTDTAQQHNRRDSEEKKAEVDWRIRKKAGEENNDNDAPKSPFPIPPPPPSRLGWRAMSDPMNLRDKNNRRRSSSAPPEPASPLPTPAAIIQTTTITTTPRPPISPGRNNNPAQASAALSLPAPRSPSYNPYTNYSPGRSSARKRREVMGMSILAPIGGGGVSPRNRHNIVSVEPQEDSSVDSEEMLERWAAQIRAELRHAEMVELALEAERAAEAGEERFSARPWTYGHDDEPEADDKNNKLVGDGATGAAAGGSLTERPTTMIRRHASYSEGLTPMRRARGRDTRIAISDLRDVDEVLPSFQVFHNNLRTHFARCNVSDETLIFEEVDDIVLASQRLAPLLPPKQPPPSPHVGSGKRISFLNTFSFDILRSSSHVAEELKVKGDRGDDEDDVGDLLAEHIHSDDPGRRRRPTLEKLPGLHEPYNPCLQLSNKAIEEETDLDLETNEALRPRTTISPRALFDQDDESFESDADTLDTETILALSKQQTPSTPVFKTLKSLRGVPAGGGPDFLTPARLREIRGHKLLTDEKIAAMLDKDNLLLSVNSVLHESPLKSSRKTRRHSSSGAVGARDGKSPPPKLLLPTLPLSRGSEGNLYNTERAITLRPSMVEDSLDRHIAPPDIESETNNLPANQPTFQDRHNMPQPPKVLPPRIIRREKLDNEVSSPGGSVSSAKKKDKIRRRVRVSIFSTSPSKQRGDRKESLQESHFIWLERKNSADSNDDTTTSAPSDCACLNLAPALSLESLDDLRDDNVESSHKKPALPAPHSKPDLSRPILPMGADCDQARARPIAAAMHMLSKFSPKKRSRLNLKSKELFVKPRENDDFMQNYLYCSRPQSPRPTTTQKEICSSGEPCQEGDRFCDNQGIAGMNNCCGAFMTDSVLDIMPRRSATPQLLLSRKSSNSRLDPETWFDVATEGVDVMIERLVGNGQPKPYNRSFQPPSLRKSHQAEGSAVTGSNSGPRSIDESFHQEVNSESQEEEKKFDGPLVQALFEAPHEDLSDTQFALIYGVSREGVQKLSGQRRRGNGSRGYAMDDDKTEVKRRLVHSFSDMDHSEPFPYLGSQKHTNDRQDGVGHADRDLDFLSLSF